MVKYYKHQLDHIFHALSDSTRRDILHMCTQKNVRISDLCEPFDMSFVAVSKHVKVLEEAELITRKVKGRTHWIGLNQESIQEARDWLNYFLKFWNDNFDQLDDYLNEQ